MRVDRHDECRDSVRDRPCSDCVDRDRRRRGGGGQSLVCFSRWPKHILRILQGCQAALVLLVDILCFSILKLVAIEWKMCKQRKLTWLTN